MSKKVFLLFISSILMIFLVSCDQLAMSDYEIWRNSGNSEDLNGDRKIDELDYEIYLEGNVVDYDAWRVSDDAEDFNGDRKIDELDYEIYVNQNAAYDAWLISDDAEDLNDDSKIDELDYNLYLNPVNPYNEWLASAEAQDYNLDDVINEEDFEIHLDFQSLAGNYSIANYVYEGNSITFGDNGLFKELGAYLDGITLVVDGQGNIDVQLTNDLILLFGDSLPIVLEALENMTIERISNFIIVIDTFATISDVVVSATLYLTEIENGFSTSYEINVKDSTAVLTFEIIKG
jgi:hypothetical protein